METTDLLGDFASGDTVPASEAMPSPNLKRDQDSTDDFEHLEREGKRDEFSESLSHHHGGARAVTQNFLDMERDEFVDMPRAPSVTDKTADHIADKFTDSESEADTTGESPLHRSESHLQKPREVAADVTEQVSRPLHDPTPVVAAVPAGTSPPTLAPAMQSKVFSPAPAEVSETCTEAKIEPATPAAESKSPEAAPQPQTEPETSSPAPSTASASALALSSAIPEKKPCQEPMRTPTAHVIEAEVIFCQMGLDAWFDPQRLHPEVESLIYWRCAARSGAVLGGGLALLVALASCSVVSVLAYAALLALAAALALRVYRNVLQAVQKTNDGHPFKWLLEKDISVGAERAQALAAAATAHLNAAAHELRRLFLVEDLVDSLKFGVLLWCLTYVGACFNGITLIILGWLALFTLPKAYEMNKAQVDANLELARAKINEISAKVRAAVPLGRKAEADKDK